MDTSSSSSSSPQQNNIYHFKILVPAAAAGRIIGKGGTTIAQLQKDAGARVKMSKASEFYPGTTERVCLISGPIEGILKINDFFMENFSSTSVKILVPNSTAGMIIGKGGNYIKQIKEDSGAYVQISQKCTQDLSLPERCVTIIGELDNIRKACAMILSKIVEDVGSAYRDIRTSSITTSIFPQHNNNNTNSQSPLHLYHQQSSTSPNSSLITSSNSHHHYNNLNNGNQTNSIVKSLTPDHLSYSTSFTGSANSSATGIVTTNTLSNGLVSVTGDSGGGNSGSGLISAAQSPSSAMAAASVVSSELNSAQIIESIKLVLRVSGYGEDAVSEITSAMSTLASYGVLGVGLGLL